MADDTEGNSQTMPQGDSELGDTRQSMDPSQKGSAWSARGGSNSYPDSGFSPMMGMNWNMGNMANMATMGNMGNMGNMMSSMPFSMPYSMPTSMYPQQPALRQQNKRPSESTIPPPNYTCYKCNQPGHWIYYCPNVAPGQYVPRSENTNPQQRKDNQSNERGGGRFPAEMTCMICRELIREATLVPCCGKSFCKECIKDLFDNAQKCPHCYKDNVPSQQLIPNKSLREIIEAYQKEQEVAAAPNDENNDVKETTDENQSSTKSLPMAIDDQHDGSQTKEAGPSMANTQKQTPAPSQGGQTIQVFESDGQQKRRNNIMDMNMMQSMPMQPFPPQMMAPGFMGMPDMFGAFMPPYGMFGGPDMNGMTPEMMMMFNGVGPGAANGQFPRYPGMPSQTGSSGRGRGRGDRNSYNQGSRSDDDNNSMDGGNHTREPTDESMSAKGVAMADPDEDIPTGPRAERGPPSTSRHSRRRPSRSPSYSRSPAHREQSHKRSASPPAERSRSKSDRTDERHTSRQPSSSRSHRSAHRRSSSRHRSDDRDRYRSSGRSRDRSRDKGRDRDRSRDRGRARESREREGERNRDRGRDRSRDGGRHGRR